MEPKIIREFYLLSLNPKNGYYFNAGPEFQYGLLGALLADLYINQRIAIQSRSLVMVNPAVTNYPFYDRALETISRRGPLRISNMLGRMSFRPGWYKKQLIGVLLANGDLVQVRKKFLGIPYNRYFHLKHEERTALVRRLRDVVLRGETPGAGELLLLALVHICGMYKSLSERGEDRRQMRQRLKQLLKNGAQYTRQYEGILALTKGVKQAIRAAHASNSAGS